MLDEGHYLTGLKSSTIWIIALLGLITAAYLIRTAFG